MTIDEIMSEIRYNDFDVTFSGGDPLCNLEAAIELAKSIKAEGLGLWIYTGYIFEDILSDSNLKRILPYVDVIVDGPYIDSLRDISLRFRGSSNQRIVNVKDSLKSGVTKIWGK